jgi:tellurium resistance protein TerZ
MAIRLEKGQRINLEKSNGSKLTKFMVGCNWGALTTGRKIEVVVKEGFLGFGRETKWVDEEIDLDLDLSCLMVDANGQLVDTLYSPLYNGRIYPANFSKVIAGLPKGCDWSKDRSMYHTPDDTEGDKGGDDGLDNEIVTVDLEKVSPNIEQIFFFLDIFSPQGIDFLKIPYAAIRMCEYDGTQTDVRRVTNEFAKYDVAKEQNFAGKNALILGKLYRRNGEWKFAAIGEAFNHSDGKLPNSNLALTIQKILNSYAK